MARTAWPTFLSGDSFSAAQSNTYNRDNDLAYWVYTTAGDLAYAASSNTLARRGIGSEGQVLTVVSGVPDWANSAWPVGSIYISVVSTNPNTLFGFGTWTAFGTGRTLVAIDAGQSEFDTVEETGGAKTHTLLTAEMPSHSHTQNAHNHEIGELWHIASGTAAWAYTTGLPGTSSQNATATNQNTGGGGAHNNLQPYIVVYMWKRTA